MVASASPRKDTRSRCCSHPQLSSRCPQVTASPGLVAHLSVSAAVSQMSLPTPHLQGPRCPWYLAPHACPSARPVVRAIWTAGCAADAGALHVPRPAVRCGEPRRAPHWCVLCSLRASRCRAAADVAPAQGAPHAALREEVHPVPCRCARGSDAHHLLAGALATVNRQRLAALKELPAQQGHCCGARAHRLGCTGQCARG